MAKVFLRRQLVDRGEQAGPTHGDKGHECRYENKFEKVMGELNELRAEYTPIRLNAGTDKEVTVLLERGKGTFDSPMVHIAELDEATQLRRGILIRRDGLQAVHFMTGELVELDAEATI